MENKLDPIFQENGCPIIWLWKNSSEMPFLTNLHISSSLPIFLSHRQFSSIIHLTFLAVTSAPLSRRAFTQSIHPQNAAMCNGVLFVQKILEQIHQRKPIITILMFHQIRSNNSL